MIDITALKRAKIPKSSGEYMRESTGMVSMVKPCATTALPAIIDTCLNVELEFRNLFSNVLNFIKCITSICRAFLHILVIGYCMCRTKFLQMTEERKFFNLLNIAKATKS